MLETGALSLNTSSVLGCCAGILPQNSLRSIKFNTDFMTGLSNANSAPDRQTTQVSAEQEDAKDKFVLPDLEEKSPATSILVSIR